MICLQTQLMPMTRADNKGKPARAIVLLYLGLVLLLGLPSWLACGLLGEYLVERHASPVMDTLIEAEELASDAWDNKKDRSRIYYGSDLARTMNWIFLVGKELPDQWLELADGIHFFADGTGLEAEIASWLAGQGEKTPSLSPEDGFFVLRRQKDGTNYALAGSTADLGQFRARLAAFLALLALFGLAASVGVARAIARRENALAAYAKRESLFTGDVGHELRTPLTVLKSGLEIMGSRISFVDDKVGIAPILARLERTVNGMAETVKTMLLLSRRPESLEYARINLAAVVARIVDETCISGKCRLDSEEDTGETGDATGHTMTKDQEPRPGASLTSQAPAPPLLKTLICKVAWTICQPELAAIVIRNLLENACHHTCNGRLSIVLQAGQLELRNAGLVPESLDLFARGVRGSDSNMDSKSEPGFRDSRGCGLGLAIAMRACEHLGWQISMQTDGLREETVFQVKFASTTPDRLSDSNRAESA